MSINKNEISIIKIEQYNALTNRPKFIYIGILILYSSTGYATNKIDDTEYNNSDIILILFNSFDLKGFILTNYFKK